SGALFIDNSRAFRMDPDVPLVVPQINGADALKNNGIISNPNCSTIITCMAVYPISRISPIKRMIASTYQAVSGAGMHGINELRDEVSALSQDRNFTPSVFQKQIAYNCIPAIGSDTGNGYTSEEMKMQNEGRKIMHLPDLRVTCTCVRVPVFRSHAISVSLQCERPVSVEEAEKAIAAFPGSALGKDGFPTPLETSGADTVLVGRIREDLVFDGGLALWCCGDQIRKGAATNAVEILEYIVER
ncbi:MAG: aspartate-semialdehyde dehydrogenase, partial [Oscillospiraceae bacterium]